MRREGVTCGPSDSQSSAEEPFTLKITPEGPEVIPVGQVVPLQVWKEFGDDHRELLTEAPEWKADPVLHSCVSHRQNRGVRALIVFRLTSRGPHRRPIRTARPSVQPKSASA